MSKAEKHGRNGRRDFTDEFRINAVKQAQEGSASVREVANKLGIATSLLYRWVAQSRNERPSAPLIQAPVENGHADVSPPQRISSPSLQPQSTDVGRLQMEVVELRQELSAAKQAIAYFVKQLYGKDHV